MWIDVTAEVSALETRPVATSATSRQTEPDSARMSQCRECRNGLRSDAASPSRSPSRPVEVDSETVLRAISAGGARPGAIASATGIGATRTYQAIDLLLGSGRIKQAADGALSVRRHNPEFEREGTIG